MSNKIIKDYIEILDSRNSRRLDYQKITEKTDKNNIEGQMTMDDFIELSYEEQMQQMYDESRSLKEAPYDDKNIEKLVNEYGIEGVFSRITSDYLKKLSLEDKYRLGLIGDYVEYKRLKRNNGKTHN